jgi:UDP-N-acetyl-D-mannosaminuronic acid dehydrogenase
MKRSVIGVIGLGYIGQPTVAALASVGYRVVGMDIDPKKIEQLKAGRATLYEPGLGETLYRTRDITRFTMDYEELMRECEAVLITVGTPIGEDNAPNMSALEAVVTSIAKFMRKGHVVILRSTVTPGTTVRVAAQLEQLTGMRCGTDFYVSFCPERTIEGLALYELLNLPKIIGGIDPESAARTADILGRLGGKVVKVSSATVAELCKLADNMYRALNIAFANEFGNICEAAREDAYEVVGAVNATYHRTSIFRPGLGAGGPCLSKDPVILSHFAGGKGVKTPVVDACVSANLEATMRLARETSRFLKARGLAQPRIAMLGLSFKGMPETDDSRGAPVADICQALRNGTAGANHNGAQFSFFDPIIERFEDQKVAASFEECISGANVVLFLTDHAMLRNIALEHVLAHASRPLLIMDAWHNVTINGSAIPADVEFVQIGSGR